MAYSKSTLSGVLNDRKADRALRASAFLLALEPIQKLFELENAAKQRNLYPHYLELKDTINQVAERSGGLWVPKDIFKQGLRQWVWQTSKVWLIHGGKQNIWERVGNYLTASLRLNYVEFNDPQAPRVEVQERLKHMVASSALALAVMSAEDHMREKRVRARQNVVHEIGVAQGALGFDRVIVMREEGLEDFSNMQGIVYIPFRQASLASALADLRNHLETRLV